MRKMIICGFMSLFTFLSAFTNAEAMTLSEYLISHSNQGVTNYDDGNKNEMYAFTHDKTAQTGVLTDYRYIGNDVNNYVYFNCSNDNDLNSCEVWRIIGVFYVDDGSGNLEQRVKLIRNPLSDKMEWDSNHNNEWSTASLNTYLNDNFYETLSDTAKSMIGEAIYYLGGNSIETDIRGEDYYNFERGSAVYNNRPKNWIGKIALMYPSDYIYTYALGVNKECFDNGKNCVDAIELTDLPSGWILDGNLYKGGRSFFWTLNASSSNIRQAFYVKANGILEFGNRDGSSSERGIRPVVYLKVDTPVFDGDGSKENPYQLTFIEKNEEVYPTIPDTSENTSFYVWILSLCFFGFASGFLYFLMKISKKNLFVKD